jgi:C4-type Zn-finger protein
VAGCYINISIHRDVDNDYLAYLAKCPSCGREMHMLNQFLRIEQLTGRKTLERTLVCKTCNIKIRQYVQLT